MKKSPDKTNFSDAKLLADLVRVGYLPKVWLAPLTTSCEELQCRSTQFRTMDE